MQKILIVEDDRELNRTICYALKKEGMTYIQRIRFVRRKPYIDKKKWN